MSANAEHFQLWIIMLTPKRVRKNLHTNLKDVKDIYPSIVSQSTLHKELLSELIRMDEDTAASLQSMFVLYL